MSTTEITVEATPAAWAALIRPDLERAAEAWIAAGDKLVEAKSQLIHGSFGRLLHELNMAPSTASRLMQISKSPVLRDRAHGHTLPSSWRTLAELSRLPDAALAAAIDSGSVDSHTSRAEAMRLRQGLDGSGGAGDHAALDERLRLGVKAIRESLIDSGGFVRLGVLDALLLGIPEADGGDLTIRETLLSIGIEAMSGLPRRNPEAGVPGADGADPLGELSGTIAWDLPHLWQDDHEATVRALAVLTIKAVAVPLEVRPHLLLQMLDGRLVDAVHPTTRLVVDAVLAGFAVEEGAA
ncbi:MAG: hypothetical protein WKF86_11720 [Acidimicrobiales bacterium]